jgi:hypothetical protein
MAVEDEVGARKPGRPGANSERGVDDRNGVAAFDEECVAVRVAAPARITEDGGAPEAPVGTAFLRQIPASRT